MEIDAVQKLAKTLEQTTGLEDELQIMIGNLKTSLESKYLNKATIFAKEQQHHTNANPPKEVTLLKSLSPFLPIQHQETINNLSKQIMNFQSIQTITQGMFNNTTILETRSNQDSGETQLNNNTSSQSNNIAGILLLMSLFNNE